MMNGYWGLGMWGGAALMILFWIGIILLTIWGLKLLFPDHRSVLSTSPTSAWEIAQLRYARGEISQGEYLKLIEDLKQSKETNK